MIKIEKNDYVQPNEVREEVVQLICNAFLSECYWRVFHPFSGGAYRGATHYVLVRKGSGKAIGFGDSKNQFDSEEGIHFNGCEMERAFKELIDAGYYMFKVYEYGTWMGYVCEKTPFKEKGTRVYEFTDRID